MTDSKTAKKIEVVPCQQHFGSYIVSERGVDYQIQRWPLWPITTKCCGTEAEAQAKKEELELAAACKEIAEVSQAKRAAQPTETRPPQDLEQAIASAAQVLDFAAGFVYQGWAANELGTPNEKSAFAVRKKILEERDKLYKLTVARAAAPVEPPQGNWDAACSEFKSHVLEHLKGICARCGWVDTSHVAVVPNRDPLPWICTGARPDEPIHARDCNCGTADKYPRYRFPLELAATELVEPAPRPPCAETLGDMGCELGQGHDGAHKSAEYFWTIRRDIPGFPETKTLYTSAPASSPAARPQQPCVNCGKVTNNKHCAVNDGLHVYEPAAARVEQPTPPDDVWKDCQPQVLQLDSMKFNAYFRYDVEAKCWVWWVPAIGKYTQARDRADIGPVHSLIRNYCELDVHLPATHADYEKFCAAPVVAQREKPAAQSDAPSAGPDLFTNEDIKCLEEIREESRGTRLHERIAQLERERDAAINARTHTQTWYANHYGKLQDWARKILPEEFKNQFFSCVANGLYDTSKDRSEEYKCVAGFKVVPGNYFKLDEAQQQILFDQCTRAETAESALSEARERAQKLEKFAQHKAGCNWLAEHGDGAVVDTDFGCDCGLAGASGAAGTK